jgi:molybdopterin-guanine dinucleotide biosynthesis protein A
MGGIDKPLGLWKGRPLVAHVIERIAPHCATLLISANRSREAYERLGFPVLSDQRPGTGPLAGLHAATPAMATPLLFVCAGDMPRIDPQIITRLASALSDTADTTYDAAVAHDGVQLQPLVMLVRRAALDGLEPFLQAGGRAVHAWLDTLRVATIDAADIAPSFFNVNTPGDLDTD